MTSIVSSQPRYPAPASNPENDAYEQKVAEKYPLHYEKMRKYPRSTWKEAFIVLEEDSYDASKARRNTDIILKTAIFLNSATVGAQAVLAGCKFFSKFKIETKDDWLFKWMAAHPDETDQSAELAWQAYYQDMLNIMYEANP